MRIKNITQINDFFAALSECKGFVWLESPAGDKYCLNSEFSQYLALSALLIDKGEYLDLYCSAKDDERYFLKFFKEHPDTI